MSIIDAACTEAKCNATCFAREKLLGGVHAWDGNVVITTRMAGMWAKTSSPGFTPLSTPRKTRGADRRADVAAHPLLVDDDRRRQPLSTSTSGRACVGMKPCTKAL